MTEKICTVMRSRSQILKKAIEERFYMDSDDGKHFITIGQSTIPAQYLLPKVLMCYRERYPKRAD